MTDGKRETVKAKFLEAYRGDKPLTMEVAARHAGATRVSLWQWRQNDPGFAEEVRQARDRQDSFRVQVVEDCLFDRLTKARASPAEEIFFLCNRSLARCRHVATIRAERSGPDDAPITFATLLEWAGNNSRLGGFVGNGRSRAAWR